MTPHDEQHVWLALRLAPQMTRARFYALLQRFESPARALGASAAEIATLRGFDDQAARSILEAARTSPVERELELMARGGVRLLTQNSPDYPENLRLCSTPPPLLFVRGELHPNDRYAVALVGSRNSTTYGRTVSQEFSGRLARSGITVVSGFARGVDSAAHQGAITAGGRTLAVLGNGHAVCYPAEHRALRSKILEGHGALISEYPMETPPDRYNFPERNRVIATLSLGTVVIEAAERSGALITAREALEENRAVFAVPGDITRLNSRGANALIGAGARLVQRAEDILADLSELLREYLRESDADREPTSTPGSGTTSGDAAASRRGIPANTATAAPPGAAVLAPTLTPEETLVYDLIRHEPQHMDSLAQQVDPEQLPIARLSAVLLALELKKAVRQLPGRIYAAFE